MAQMWQHPCANAQKVCWGVSHMVARMTNVTTQWEIIFDCLQKCQNFAYRAAWASRLLTVQSGHSAAYSKCPKFCLQQCCLQKSPTPLLTADHGWGQAGPSFAYSPSAAYSSGPDLLTAQVAYRRGPVLLTGGRSQFCLQSGRCCKQRPGSAYSTSCTNHRDTGCLQRVPGICCLQRRNMMHGITGAPGALARLERAG